MDIQREYLDRLASWSDIQDQLPYLYDVVNRYKKPRVLELGVRSGNSTAALLAAVEKTDGLLYSVDIRQPQVPEHWWENSRWMFIGGDSVSDDVFWHPGLPKLFDVAFMDTSHTYEQTIAELSRWEPRVKRGGCIMLHDTQWEWPSVSLPKPTGPVARALDEYCANSGSRVRWTNRHSEPGFYGLGVIDLV